MRHIRLFEGFKDDYYQEITSGEANDLEEEGRIVGFSTKDRERLDIIINDNPTTRRTIKSMRYCDDCLVFRLNDEYSSHVSIEPLEDDYYLVFTSNNKIDGSKYYKCDQWDGLMMFLKDKGIIK
jgi:hypothetical protein